jgi:hypothetical protein
VHLGRNVRRRGSVVPSGAQSARCIGT